MKVKGITIWEQYAEFIAIGIVAVVFVVYVVFQVSDDTNSVKIGSNTMSPGDVDEELKKKADSLNRRISSDAASPVEFEMPVLVEPRGRGDREFVVDTILGARDVQPIPELLQKQRVVHAVLGSIDVARETTLHGVLPVDVDAVEVVTSDELDATFGEEAAA